MAKFGILGFGMSALASDIDSQFETFKSQYNKIYDNATEEALRKSIFMENLKTIEEKNANDSAVYGVDFYSDFTVDEWKAAMGVGDRKDWSQFAVPDYQCNFENPSSSVENLNSTIDWVTAGAVTAVKSQGQFGTCGYFSTIGVMEGINVMQGGNDLVSLSEQEVIDCCTGSDGCKGWPGQELMWYSNNNFYASTEESYPYRGSSSSCKRSSATQTTATLADRICVGNGPEGNQDAILAKLQTHGPAVWMIGCQDLHQYRGGIISNRGADPGSFPEYRGIDHATLLVGAGEENGIPYWKVKNSWGESFGEQGYYRVKRNTNPPQLACPGAIFGVYSKGSDPTVV